MNSDALREQLNRIVLELGGPADLNFQLERPRNPEHGDLATNVALVLAPRLGEAPRAVAERIVERLDLGRAGVAAAEIAGPGFINFRLAHAILQARLAEIIAADRTFGRSATGQGRRIQVEFVSANPTGPLHVAHGRGAALGDAIASLLEWTGHDVTREFYVNDAGVQIERLGESLEVRWLQLQGHDLAIPEGGYHGEYLIDLAREADAEAGDRLRAMDSAERRTWFRDWAVARLRDEQDRDLRTFRVYFDSYYSERSLYTEGKIEDALRELKERGLTYEADGALWLRTTTFGDDKDRVLIKRDGSYTYFLPDIAYHRDKARRGFDHVIDVWGADHHGYVPRMQAALAALGLQDFLDVEIVQMVRILRGGKEVRLSKRSGEFITLRELIDETGVDVARYFFLMRRGDAQMVFDLDLALDQSEKNPVYKVQYAHARMMSILRKAGLDPAEVTADGVDLDRLTVPVELELIKQLGLFPAVVERAADARAPHMVADYLEETAGMVNSWYHSGHPTRNPELAVLVEDPELRRARLALVRAIQIVLRNGLELLGLTAPDRMEREATA
ncbi:MAG TPA: arginine--tRNA ligase [Longimicrobiales bacterium]|nr:arginine--tRNA ligase [Longimicrobiales bacterium]